MINAHFSVDAFPRFERYEMFLLGIKLKFTNEAQGERAALFVHHGVTVRRMLRMQSLVSPDLNSGFVSFSCAALAGMMTNLLEWSMLKRHENELFNAMEEAWKIFRDEEDAIGAQTLALQEFEPNHNMPN